MKKSQATIPAALTALAAGWAEIVPARFGADHGPVALLRTARSLFAHSWFDYEFMVVACLVGFQAMESAALVLYPDADARVPFRKLVGRARDDAILPTDIAKVADAGVQLRNALSRPATQTTFTLPIAISTLESTHRLVALMLNAAMHGETPRSRNLANSAGAGHPGDTGVASHAVTRMFLLGAGFSHAVSNDMPLLADLPQELARLRPEPNLRDLLERHSGNIEHVLTYLAQAQPFLHESENLRNRADFLDVVRNIGDIIEVCQQNAVGYTRSCPPWFGPLIELWHSEGSHILTFNWDTLVEKMYCAGGADRDASQIYAVPLSQARARSGVAMVGGKRVETFRLMKLHGSINWYYSGAESFFGESVYYTPVAAGWQPDSGHEATYDKVPLIVPPTVEKSSFFANESVRSQWRQASVGLEYVSDLFILGYSMPETDMLVRFMLSRLGRLGHGTRVHLVNKLQREPGATSDETCERFISRHQAVLPVDPLRVNGDFVRVDEDVLPAFVQALSDGTL